MTDVLMIKKENAALYFAIMLFLFFTGWWIINQFFIGHENIYYGGFGDFADLYGIMALYGGVIGVYAAFRIGLKYEMGRALLFFGLGLLAQVFGQLSYSLYFVFYNRPVPYPSIGDIGFFGSVIFYLVAVVFLMRALKIKAYLQTSSAQIQFFFVLLAVFIFSYWFLFEYSVFHESVIKNILNVSYPFFQALYIGLALNMFLFISRDRDKKKQRYKKPMLFILIALVAQYYADYNFIYQIYTESWFIGGYGEYFYFVAYFLMTVFLLRYWLNKEDYTLKYPKR